MESEKYSWQGYLRQDGRCGIRNHILVIYTVKCSEFVARKIVENSDDPDVELIGFDGCTDNQYAVNLLISMIRHPNVGAVLAVGLGCEYIQPEWLADIARKEGKPSEWLFIQNEGGTLNAVKKGLDWVGKAKKMLLQVPRVPMGVQDLVIGAECGGSDYTSGLAGNVVVGRLYDRLVDLGGTAIFEEIVEAIGLDHLLIQRAVDERPYRRSYYISSARHQKYDVCPTTDQIHKALVIIWIGNPKLHKVRIWGGIKQPQTSPFRRSGYFQDTLDRSGTALDQSSHTLFFYGR